jgi:hypothetical protein
MGLGTGLGTGDGSWTSDGTQDGGGASTGGTGDGGTGGTDDGGTNPTDGSGNPTDAPSSAGDTTSSDATTSSEETACPKVDMLFVIDNSGSMLGSQQNLTNSFPGFEYLMMQTIRVDELNLGVVTSDAYSYNEPACTALGSLVTQTYAATCSPYADGNRFMTENDDLAEKFACAGLVGDLGNGDEHQLEAGTKAISPALNDPGACNEGFLRPDALLVFVLVTDEDDGPINPGYPGGSPGDPSSWFATVVGIKGNIEENVVVLSLLWGMANNVCDESQGSQREGVRIRDFTSMFTYGFIGDICAPDYSPFFAEAVSVIDDACTNFTPP